MERCKSYKTIKNYRTIEGVKIAKDILSLPFSAARKKPTFTFVYIL